MSAVIVYVMTSGRWRQVSGVLADAMERDGDERERYLSRVCAEDPELRSEVEAYLKADQTDGDFAGTALDFVNDFTEEQLRLVGAASVSSVPQVTVSDLVPYTTLRISTKRTSYEILVVSPVDREILIQGGLRFPAATVADLRHDLVAVGEGLVLHHGDRRVSTSAVTTIRILALGGSYDLRHDARPIG